MGSLWAALAAVLVLISVLMLREPSDVKAVGGSPSCDAPRVQLGNLPTGPGTVYTYSSETHTAVASSGQALSVAGAHPGEALILGLCIAYTNGHTPFKASNGTLECWSVSGFNSTELEIVQNGGSPYCFATHIDLFFEIPAVPTSTPTRTPVPATSTSVATATPTSTAVPSSTASPTPLPSATASATAVLPVATSTATSVPGAVVTATSTLTADATPTASPPPDATPTPTLVPDQTATVTSTQTPVATKTPTPAASGSVTPAAAPTWSPNPTSTHTPVAGRNLNLATATPTSTPETGFQNAPGSEVRGSSRGETTPRPSATPTIAIAGRGGSSRQLESAVEGARSVAPQQRWQTVDTGFSGWGLAAAAVLISGGGLLAVGVYLASRAR